MGSGIAIKQQRIGDTLPWPFLTIHCNKKHHLFVLQKIYNDAFECHGQWRKSPSYLSSNSFLNWQTLRIFSHQNYCTNCRAKVNLVLFFNLIFFLVLEIKTMHSKRCYPAQSKMKREVFIGLCHFFKMKIPESETYWVVRRKKIFFWAFGWTGYPPPQTERMD